MACKHVNAPELHPPGPSQSVYREDCTQCFDSIDDLTGLDVCLCCFNGGCTGPRQHSALHYVLRSHPLVLNIRRTRKQVVRDEPPQKISKLAIAAETEADRYDYETTVKCYDCNIDNVDKSSGKLSAVVDGVMKANTFSRKEEVKAWELEMTSCEHILLLQQEPARKIESQLLGHCSLCDLQENLWLCLHCGNLGCGRAQFGGIQGHGHGLEHKNTTGHAVAVKLGSISPEGTADVFCYACDEERVDENIGAHLANWGIILADRQKTEKSLTEMQVDQNLNWDFTMTDESGREYEKLYGEGLTGLKNLGNSCYLASTLQCLFSLPQFKKRYYLPESDLPTVDDPAQDLETQMRKVADGLLSGRYSKPDPDAHSPEGSSEIPYQRGLAPAMTKYLIGRGHEEFSTMRQQDAFEFLLHVFKLVTRSKHEAPFQDPTQAFRFVMEQRLQCLNCKKVRYRTDEQDNISIPVPIKKISQLADVLEADKKDEYEPVTLKACLDGFTSTEIVELTCASCGSKDGFSKRSLFKTFPEVLAVNARRFNIINWVPTKVDVPVVVDDEPFLLDEYKSPGQQPSEELLPEDASDNKPSFVANENAVQQLEGMGFPRNRAEKALHATGNSDANAAMEWLFSHMEDPDIDAPLDLGGGSTAASGSADPEKIETLGAMGFGPPQARKALKETGGDMERAVEWLFSHPDDQGEFEDEAPAVAEGAPKYVPGSSDLPAKFQLQSIICHKGASIHAGHYVAFIRKLLEGESSPSWVLYNDEKVVKANDVEEMKKFAYVYFFQRQ
ncbi:ubiquitin carboxyl-terminal hydrolase-like protein [Mollisia scopiformis]|uniref:Ubiquitin carboxyl-terminal hydrolase n=1 Tax=Mollisia scopiformis TaxID=149040 RepID=A0A194X6A3_MOLSC|nr:ubiquitin carboxyl-terminal hydrolase-like protein [Mollisia scopiformis]KUJ15703.1 ubiquitin carboxyl-terminal hydrolase-like protein [Mollisia scopiformis]